MQRRRQGHSVDYSDCQPPCLHECCLLENKIISSLYRLKVKSYKDISQSKSLTIPFLAMEPISRHRIFGCVRYFRQYFVSMVGGGILCPTPVGVLWVCEDRFNTVMLGNVSSALLADDHQWLLQKPRSPIDMFFPFERAIEGLLGIPCERMGYC